MSADNWAICPKCNRIAEEKHLELVKQVEDAYGNVSAKDFIDLLDKKEQPIKLDNTLREDYELGVDENGNFYVNYRCHCYLCGFDYKFKESYVIDLR